ncbi:hypothetical protein pb186bvf_002722 [Paramecium bursaria]
MIQSNLINHFLALKKRMDANLFILVILNNQNNCLEKSQILLIPRIVIPNQNTFYQGFIQLLFINLMILKSTNFLDHIFINQHLPEMDYETLNHTLILLIMISLISFPKYLLQEILNLQQRSNLFDKCFDLRNLQGHLALFFILLEFQSYEFFQVKILNKQDINNAFNNKSVIEKFKPKQVFLDWNSSYSQMAQCTLNLVLKVLPFTIISLFYCYNFVYESYRFTVNQDKQITNN